MNSQVNREMPNIKKNSFECDPYADQRISSPRVVPFRSLQAVNVLSDTLQACRVATRGRPPPIAASSACQVRNNSSPQYFPQRQKHNLIPVTAQKERKRKKNGMQNLHRSLKICFISIVSNPQQTNFYFHSFNNFPVQGSSKSWLVYFICQSNGNFLNVCYHSTLSLCSSAASVFCSLVHCYR